MESCTTGDSEALQLLFYLVCWQGLPVAAHTHNGDCTMLARSMEQSASTIRKMSGGAALQALAREKSKANPLPRRSG